MAKILTDTCLNKLSKRRDVKLIISDDFGLDEDFGVRTVNRWMKNNKPNGPLTSDAVLTVLIRHLLMDKKQILINV